MGWIRQSDLDANGGSTPIPTRIASNEEFIPPPQSAEQREVELRFWAMAERAATRLNLTRRDFLRSSLAMTTAMIAMNQVFGKVYAVDDDESENVDKVKEKWPKNQFIFDVQTHHVDVDQKWYDDTEEGRAFKRFARMIRPGRTIESSVSRKGTASAISGTRNVSSAVLRYPDSPTTAIA